MHVMRSAILAYNVSLS